MLGHELIEEARAVGTMLDFEDKPCWGARGNSSRERWQGKGSLNYERDQDVCRRQGIQVEGGGHRD